MLAYILRRLLLAVFTVWAITILAWIVIQVPQGDVVDRYLDLVQVDGMGVDAEAVGTELRIYLGI